MPEGDTIWRTAHRLRPVLAGKTIARFEAPRLAVAGPSTGTLVDAVEAKGKYLLVHFGNGTTLETHMKMSGSWHIYKSGERWRRSPRGVRALIETTEGWLAVCFDAPIVELVSRRSGPTHLGPDLTGPEPDLARAAARFGLAEAGTPVAVALLDQRICCGVGNVYKSEVLHAEGLAPQTPVESIASGLRHNLVARAHLLLRSNLDGGPRVTVPGGLAVYGRKGEPCLRCGVLIERIVQGEHARSTYWCPGCQHPPAGVRRPNRDPAEPGQ